MSEQDRVSCDRDTATAATSTSKERSMGFIVESYLQNLKAQSGSMDRDIAFLYTHAHAHCGSCHANQLAREKHGRIQEFFFCSRETPPAWRIDGCKTHPPSVY